MLAMQNADRFRTELLRRGVLLVPVVWGEGQAPQIEKKGFGHPQKQQLLFPPLGYDTRLPLFVHGVHSHFYGQGL